VQDVPAQLARDGALVAVRPQCNPCCRQTPHLQKHNLDAFVLRPVSVLLVRSHSGWLSSSRLPGIALHCVFAQRPLTFWDTSPESPTGRALRTPTPGSVVSRHRRSHRQDDGAGGVLGDELERLGQGKPDAFGREQGEGFLLLGKVRPDRIARAVAHYSLPFGKTGHLGLGESGHRLSHLRGKAGDEECVVNPAFFGEPPGVFCRSVAHGCSLQADVEKLAFVPAAEPG